jgi:hypothetical protein
MMPGMAPGMMPAQSGAPGQSASPVAAAAGQTKDSLLYLPPSITFAVGGRPAALVEARSALAASLLEQFRPLFGAIARAGLQPGGVDRFWAGTSADQTEQIFCLVLKSKLELPAFKQLMNGAPAEKIGPSIFYNLVNSPGRASGLCMVDETLLLGGRKSTIEAAIKRPKPGAVRLGLAAMNSLEAEFWMAGDQAAAEESFKQGLPLAGPYTSPFQGLQGFAVALNTEQTAAALQTATGGAAGMMGGATTMGAAADPNAMAMQAYAGQQPGAAGQGGNTAGAGLLVIAGFAFDAESAAETTQKQFDRFLNGTVDRLKPAAAGSAPNSGAGAGQVYGNPAMMAAAAPNSSGATALAGGDSSGGNGPPSQPRPPVPVRLDSGLKPIAPPNPLPTAAAAAAAAAASSNPATNPGAPAAMTAAGVANPASPMPQFGATPPPNAPLTTPPNAPLTATPPANPGAAFAGAGPGAGFPGAAAGGNNPPPAVALVWGHRVGSRLQVAYRFDAARHPVFIAGEVLQASGTSATTGGLIEATLPVLARGAERLRTEKVQGLKGVARLKDVGDVEWGYSWMTHLLPFVGHDDLYVQFNFEKGWADEANYGLTHRVVPQFVNPADPRVQWQGSPFSGMGLSHFVGMAGVADRPDVVAAALPRTDPRAGIFGYDEVAGAEQITDGQASTILLIGSGRLAGPWVKGGGSTIRGARDAAFDELAGFGSQGLAARGAYVVLADGSIRTLSADIDPSVFRALCTMHGAEQVDLSALADGAPPQTPATPASTGPAPATPPQP